VQVLSPARAAAAGSAETSLDEVLTAMHGLPPSSSPGPDGIPYAYWRINDGAWAPLLARLFTAIGTCGEVPPSFTLGSIPPLPIPGAADTRQPAAYRPITLLPALYRILARVLAARFAPVLRAALGAEQNAFLPGRRIEDSILHTSLMHHAMCSAGLSGAALFLDIAKAFDSVSRAFLYQVMHTLGASEGMVAWARLLLSHSLATTHANGVESSPAEWHASVRPGCPLSPLLYLLASLTATTCGSCNLPSPPCSLPSGIWSAWQQLPPWSGADATCGSAGGALIGRIPGRKEYEPCSPPCPNT
jgi:hypothetical protein